MNRRSSRLSASSDAEDCFSARSRSVSDTRSTDGDSESLLRTRGKRRIENDVDFEYDTDLDYSGRLPSKITTARRGRGKTTNTAPHLDVLQVDKVMKSMENESFLKPSSSAVVKPKKASTSKETIVPPDESFNAAELYNCGLQAIEKIANTSKKSKNLKGTCRGEIYDATVAVKESLEYLRGRTMSEETRRLRADNDRLKREVAHLQAEMKAFKEAYHESRAIVSPAVKPTSVVEVVVDEQNMTSPQSSSVLDAEAITRAVIDSVGGWLNIRLKSIEERLPPPKNVRPPLAADQKLAKTFASASQKNNNLSEVEAVTPSQTASVPMTSSNDWVTVIKKGQKKRDTTAAQMSQSASQPAQASVPAAKKRTNLNLPRSSAVVLTLQPEAVERGVTYADVMGKAKAAINLEELGIDGIRSRQTLTGARILELPGSTSGPKADILAEKLKAALSDVVHVVRPVKCVDIRISGLDDSLSKSDIIAAISTKGGCSAESIKTGEIRLGLGGSGTVIVSCPVVAAKTLLEAGRLLIGWSSCFIKALDARPLRCFRCMGIGHTRERCDSNIDRSDYCFRCGKPGHKAMMCSAEPICSVCTAAKLPSAHVMGGRNCDPPASKGKPIPNVPLRSVVRGNVIAEIEMLEQE